MVNVSIRRTLTGAWIETNHIPTTTVGIIVAPSRVRGLKQKDLKGVVCFVKVAPSRVRGLKHR